MQDRTRLDSKDLLLGVLAFLLIGIVFASGIFTKPQIFAGLNYTDVAMDKNPLSVESGDAYGVHSSGPYYSLPAGHYRLRLNAYTDGAAHLTLLNDNHVKITPDRLDILPDEDFHTLEFDIPEAASRVSMAISFDSGTYLNVEDIRLYTPRYRDHAFTFALILLLVCGFLIGKRHHRFTSVGICSFVLLATAVIVTSAPVLKDNIARLIDLEFQMARIENLADGLRAGSFPVRAGGFTFNGYGAITSVFYPDLLLVPFALLRLLGASPTYVVSLFCILAGARSAYFAWHCGRRLFNDTAGVLFGILYVCCAYRLNNFFIRGALGEGLAMVFYPLFIEGLWNVLYGDAFSWRTLTAGAFLIFMSHILSTIAAAMIAIFLCALCLPRLITQRQRILALLKAAAATLGLSLFFLVPLFMCMREGINAAAINWLELQNTAISPAQLFLISRGNLITMADATLSPDAVELGLPIVLGTAMAISRIVSGSSRETPWLLPFLLCGLGFAFMATTLFPLSYVSLITTFFNRYQFARRFIGPASLLLCLVSAYVLSDIHELHPVMVLALALLCVLPTISEQARRGSFFRLGESTSGDLRYYEYQLPDTNLDLTLDREPHLSGDVMLSDYHKDGTRIDATVSHGNGEIDFPLFAFTGYRATFHGQELPISRGENNRIRLVLPDETGALSIRYRTPVLWRVFDLVSLVTLIYLLPIWKRRKPIISQ